ncbi:MAG: hypothetical protein AAGJ52_12080 [Pseudomonadota bacterium]
MTYALYMSTDYDILHTPLNHAWNPVVQFDWQAIAGMTLGLAPGSDIVVLAHGNGHEIGNAEPGTVDIDAYTFLALIQANMNGGPPGRIFISTCGEGIAQFAAHVRLIAEANDLWHHTEIFGHSDPVAGPVPPPHDLRWTQIF